MSPPESLRLRTKLCPQVCPQFVENRPWLSTGPDEAAQTRWQHPGEVEPFHEGPAVSEYMTPPMSPQEREIRAWEGLLPQSRIGFPQVGGGFTPDVGNPKAALTAEKARKVLFAS